MRFEFNSYNVVQAETILKVSEINFLLDHLSNEFFRESNITKSSRFWIDDFVIKYNLEMKL